MTRDDSIQIQNLNYKLRVDPISELVEFEFQHPPRVPSTANKGADPSSKMHPRLNQKDLGVALFYLEAKYHIRLKRVMKACGFGALLGTKPGSGCPNIHPQIQALDLQSM